MSSGGRMGAAGPSSVLSTSSSSPANAASIPSSSNTFSTSWNRSCMLASTPRRLVTCVQPASRFRSCSANASASASRSRLSRLATAASTAAVAVGTSLTNCLPIPATAGVFAISRCSVSAVTTANEAASMSALARSSGIPAWRLRFRNDSKSIRKRMSSAFAAFSAAASWLSLLLRRVRAFRACCDAAVAAAMASQSILDDLTLPPPPGAATPADSASAWLLVNTASTFSSPTMADAAAAIAFAISSVASLGGAPTDLLVASAVLAVAIARVAVRLAASKAMRSYALRAVPAVSTAETKVATPSKNSSTLSGIASSTDIDGRLPCADRSAATAVPAPFMPSMVESMVPDADEGRCLGDCDPMVTLLRSESAASEASAASRRSAASCTTFPSRRSNAERAAATASTATGTAARSSSSMVVSAATASVASSLLIVSITRSCSLCAAARAASAASAQVVASSNSAVDPFARRAETLCFHSCVAAASSAQAALTAALEYNANPVIAGVMAVAACTNASLSARFVGFFLNVAKHASASDTAFFARCMAKIASWFPSIAA